MICSVDICDRKAKSRGLCNRHYENLRLYGSAIPQRERSLSDRFAEMWRLDEKGCWIWQGQIKTGYEGGYGLVRWKNSPSNRAHVVSYILYKGNPQGVIRHTCDERSCVNPEHLIDGTQADNIADMRSRERSSHWGNDQKATHCPNGHLYTDNRPFGAFKFRCEICNNLRQQRWRSKKALR